MGAGFGTISQNPTQHSATTRIIKRRARLVAADLGGVRFVAVTISGADFSNANLRSADLSGTDGSHIRFVGACLRDTVWDRANLTVVNFDRADLRGADMRRVAQVVPVSAEGALYDDGTQFPTNKTVCRRDRSWDGLCRTFRLLIND